MSKQKTLFGVDRQMINRIDSLDEKWFVEFWIVKYYFLGIEVHIQKKEIVKYVHHKHLALSRQA